MATVIVVEPHQPARMRILQLLETMAPAIQCEGADYSRLFQNVPALNRVDLVLLSVPGQYERMVDLVAAARGGFAPHRILLLSDTPTLPYSLHDQPSILAGYIPKDSSPDMMKAAITLVLAGGKCFQTADGSSLASTAPAAVLPADSTPRRRWYDKLDTQAARATDAAMSLSGFAHDARMPGPVPEMADPGPDLPLPEEHDPLCPSLVNTEAALLNITPRQYEVLVLLARGYPMKTVGRQLNISVATAKAHTETLYQRLDVHNRNAAVYAAVSRGATLGWRKSDLPENAST
ncbi:response regulator transcription factor [Paralcaligenes ginsengisoli]